MKIHCKAFACIFIALRSGAELAPHTFGIFANLAATERSIEMPAFMPRNIYVVAVKVEPMSGWEASISIDQPGWSVIGSTLNPPNAVCISSGRNHIVGLGGCYFEGPTYLLVTYQVGWFGTTPPPTDTLMCIGGTTPSTFQGLPGYAGCHGELIPAQPTPALGTLPAGCLVFNPTTIVPSESQSWGAIKARYAD